MVAPLSGCASTLSHLEHVGAVSPIVQLHRRSQPVERGHRAIQWSRSLLLLVVPYAAASLRFIGAAYFLGGTHRAGVRLRVLLLLLAALHLAPHFQAVFFGRAAFRQAVEFGGFCRQLVRGRVSLQKAGDHFRQDAIALPSQASLFGGQLPP